MSPGRPALGSVTACIDRAGGACDQSHRRLDRWWGGV